ncbi:MAG TPA: hypothetical protein VGH73_03710 [Thermoanaerobaculia bacterium]|jgi:hypothetical protein
MKKSFAYVALCALTLAAPAAAERIYVPVLGDGSALTTKVWVAGAERQVAAAAGRAGLVALEAGSAADVRALMAGRGGKDGAEVPAFTEDELYQAGVEVPLGDLPRPREMASLSVGAANLSEQTASCRATLSRPDGSRLGEIQFEVEPMSLARRAAAGRGQVGAVTVTCDQSFYPLAVATDAKGLKPIIAKGIGPNGACALVLTLFQQLNGHYSAVSPPGVFHSATKANPKGIICIRSQTELHIAKATYEWDTTLGPWSPRDHSGLHNLGYFFLDRYRSGVIGNVNFAGPNKNYLKFMQNVGMVPGTNTSNKLDYVMQTNLTYHQIYTFDAANKQARLQVYLNGLQVASFSLATQPGNNQTLIVKPFNAAGNTNLALIAEFGNYLNQHHPEEATVGWKYSNFKVDMISK